jgi:hypothetical protein
MSRQESIRPGWASGGLFEETIRPDASFHDHAGAEPKQRDTEAEELTNDEA